VKISVVEYLNSAPLYWGLRDGLHPAEWEVAFHVPAECARRLSAGEADVGLVPSIEFARDPGLRLAAPLCVAARREVTSVLLLAGSALASITKVYLDPTSRTSQALARLLLAWEGARVEEYQESSRFPCPLPAGEAALVIGDRALALGRARGTGVRYDLAEIWNRHTGLPFVFAVWAGREGACTPMTRKVLEESRSHGARSLDAIVGHFAPRLGLAGAEVHRYLTEHLHFDLGDREVEAMARFFAEVLREDVSHERFRLPVPAP
jgi:chorismate dehydratase